MGMDGSGRRRLSLRGWAILSAILIGASSCRSACAYNPQSKEVQESVARAIRFLESDQNDSRHGAYALVGIALLKQGEHPSHAKIVSAVRHLQRQIAHAGDPSKLSFDIYSAALSVIFFVTLDADRYRSEISFLLRYLQAKQKPHGGWGYDVRETGDTSMTQNAVLALWEAEEAGVPVPHDMVDRALVWLLKTQDPSGGFGYQGRTSEDFTPVQQSMVKPSMSGAGLGSVYICAHMLRIGKPQKKEDDNLPPGMRKVEKAEPRAKSRIDPGLVQRALDRGKAWMDKNFVIEQRDYHLYNLYTVERYHTFREIAEGKPEAEPGWYNDGVRYLLKNQQQDGSWEGTSGTIPATAFGVLFLIRSTKISAGKAQSFGDGTLIGGKGLPKNTAGIAVVDGNVRAKPELGALDKLLAHLDNEATPDAADALEALAELPSEKAEDLVSRHVKMLREMVGNSSAEARLAAVRALGKRRDLDSVPALLYALTDPDPAVVREARDSLRRISRRFEGFGMSDEPTDIERHAAIRKWQQWYLQIRPDAELEY
jgi:hypothetical protein